MARARHCAREVERFALLMKYEARGQAALARASLTLRLAVGLRRLMDSWPAGPGQ